MSSGLSPKQNRWTLRFAGSLETEFKEYYQKRSRSFLTTGALVAIAAILVTGILPYANVWGDQELADRLRAIMTTQLVPFYVLLLTGSIGTLILVRRESTWRYREQILAINSVFAHGLLAVAAFQIPSSILLACFTGVIMFLMTNYVSVVYRFPFAVATGVSSSLIWLYVFLELDVYPTFYGPPLMLFLYLLFANLTGGSVVRLLESNARRQFLLDRLLETERLKSERLLLNVMPEKIANRLKAGESSIAEQHGEVSVMFADLVGFTKLSQTYPAARVVDLLNDLYSLYDELAAQNGVEKIKTIGDSYLCVAGLPEFAWDHAERAVAMGLAMLDATDAFNRQQGSKLSLRIGIASGPLVAGIIGKSKFSYDVWGDTVNTAARMESTGRAGTLQVSEATFQLARRRFAFEAPETKQVKGKGEMVTYTVRREKPVLERRDAA